MNEQNRVDTDNDSDNHSGLARNEILTTCINFKNIVLREIRVTKGQI